MWKNEEAEEIKNLMDVFKLRELGEKMCHWHSNHSDAIYAVGSYFVSGLDYPNPFVIFEARASIRNMFDHPHNSWDNERDLRELKEILEGLEVYLEGRRKEESRL